jgi:hypothetical protein
MFVVLGMFRTLLVSRVLSCVEKRRGGPEIGRVKTVITLTSPTLGSLFPFAHLSSEMLSGDSAWDSPPTTHRS